MGGSETRWSPRQLQWTIDCSKSSPTLTGHQCSLGFGFTETKLVTSTVTGRWVNGQITQHSTQRSSFLLTAQSNRSLGQATLSLLPYKVALGRCLLIGASSSTFNQAQKTLSVIQDQTSLSSISFVRILYYGFYPLLMYSVYAFAVTCHLVFNIYPVLLTTALPCFALSNHCLYDNSITG